ncbi:MAG: 4-hydroxythreonine-4-phosphate dehydrogenase PdxA, partial [Bacteroidetes bacterium]|nr:4-hydroxythreonine-4-phosphate dehydrogenase PdxA [Bacteroidota bacterium]
MDNQKVKLGITQGDPSGVGMELILRVFAEQYIYKYCIPVVYGNTKTFIAWKKHLDLQEPMYHLINSATEAKEGKLNWVLSSDAALELTIGTASPESGKEALLAIDKAIADAHNLDALVTAPIDKSTVAPHSPNFTGHTGYLADALGARSHAMILACEDLRVALVTEHVP